MDSAYLSAFAALAGSVIGGLTSLSTSWLTYNVQFSAQQLAHDIGRRQVAVRLTSPALSSWERVEALNDEAVERLVFRLPVATRSSAAA